MSFFNIRTACFLFALFLFASCGKPVASFVYDSSSETVPTEVEFENTSQKALTYEWHFGDGNSSNELSPSHAYTQSGNYEVTLIATAKNGKSTTTKQRVMIKPPTECLVEIQTNFGNMVVKLFDETPKHRDNFFKLAEAGFYDDLLFHRVIDGFMIQGGDPESRDAKPGAHLGSGGPGYKIPAEFNEQLVHTKGMLAAARQGDQVNPQRASSGSQFYIVQGKPLNENEIASIERRMGLHYSDVQKEAYRELGGTPFLDGQYTVFGEIISGMEVIDKIAEVKTNAANRPLEDVKMKVVPVK